MNFFKGSNLFGIGLIFVLFVAANGQIAAGGIQSSQKGTITVQGNVLLFEKSAKRLVVSDKNGKSVFRWDHGDKQTKLKDFDFNTKSNCFVVLIEIFDPAKETFSLVCEGASFKETVRSNSEKPFGGAVYFGMEDGQQWVVFSNRENVVIYYNMEKKRPLAMERYPEPILSIEKAVMDGKRYLIYYKLDNGDVRRRYARHFHGQNPFRNPLLPLEQK